MGGGTAATPTVRRLLSLDEAQRAELSELLIVCVAAGAEVSFMHPLPMADAMAFWSRIAGDVASGGRALLAAVDGERIVGTVQVGLAQPPNQPHRGDLAKMIVHPDYRRRGLGEALMRAAEDAARAAGKTLLVLDTASEDAERLYRKLGWIEVGTIPGFALKPHGGLSRTTLYYRTL